MSTAECGGAHGEGKGGGGTNTDSFEESRKYREERGFESEFSDDLQILLFSQSKNQAAKKTSLSALPGLTAPKYKLFPC